MQLPQWWAPRDLLEDRADCYGRVTAALTQAIQHAYVVSPIDMAGMIGMIDLVSAVLQSRSLSGRHVSTGFLDPVLGAMMKQVCWHSRRSKAYRGLPEARMAEATVEETAFEDVNMWQAPVSQKPPLMGT